jgi:hypothetical protein
MKPMLATPISNERFLNVCSDDQWAIQGKINGRRLCCESSGTSVQGWGRDGQRSDVPPAISRALEGVVGTVDGELVNGTLWLFDQVTDGSFATRIASLSLIAHEHNWIADAKSPVRLVTTVVGEISKLGFAQHLLSLPVEGVIARDLTRRYEHKRSSGLLKLRYVHSVDCVVMAVRPTGRDNIVVGLYENDTLVEIGPVVAPRNPVQVGDVVEVEYQSATAARHLVMPTKPRLRTDKLPEECTIDQLVYLSDVIL